VAALNSKSFDKRLNPLLERAEYDKEQGEIRIAGEDWIMMGASTFRDLVRGTESMLGSAAKVVWLEAGRHAGRKFSGDLVQLGIEFEELPFMLEEFFTQGGWGKIQTEVDFTKKEALITIKNSATARQTETKEPICHFIRGFIAGVCDVIFHGSTECFETKCIAKGDSVCQFQVRGKVKT
jgi:predicted hydrocarbon binding protein